MSKISGFSKITVLLKAQIKGILEIWSSSVPILNVDCIGLEFKNAPKLFVESGQHAFMTL